METLKLQPVMLDHEMAHLLRKLGCINNYKTTGNAILYYATDNATVLAIHTVDNATCKTISFYAMS